MSEIKRMPATAAEAEAQLRADGKLPAPSATPPSSTPTPVPQAEDAEDPLNDKQKALIAAVEKFTPKLKGLSETAADIILPGGKIVHLVKPKTATQIAQYQILSQLVPSGEYPDDLKNMVHMLMYVDSVDGEKAHRPENKVEVQDLLNKIGDEYVQHVTNGWFQHFMMKGVTLPL